MRRVRAATSPCGAVVNVGQGQGRVVYQDVEVRGSLPARVSRPGRSPIIHWALPRKDLQPEATSFGTGLPPAGGVRAFLARTRGKGKGISVSFGRHGEISSDRSFTEGKEWPASRCLARRRNEFPVGYSLAGCSPAEPTSASPTACQCPSEVFGSREILSQRYTVS